MPQPSGPPIQSVNVCAGKNGGGKKASSTSHQHNTQVPVGVVPPQLSLPVTCLHQLLLLGPGCHQQSSSTPTHTALPRPGYPCLTTLSRFSHTLLSSDGRSKPFFYFPWKGLLALSHPMSYTLIHGDRIEWPLLRHTHFSTCVSLFPLGSSPRPSANPEKSNSLTRNPLHKLIRLSLARFLH